MTTLRYKSSSIAMEALRGSVGLVICLIPPIFVEAVLKPVEILCWCLAALFAVYLLRTAIRHKTAIEITQDAITATSPLGRRELPWKDVQSVRLGYFASARTQKGEGVLSLKLRGNGTKIIVESSLTEFDRLAETVAGLCTRPDIDIDFTSMHNFEAMGIPVERSGK